jgi:hypothetical protein
MAGEFSMGVAPVIECVVPPHHMATEDLDARNKYGHDEKGKESDALLSRHTRT